MKYGLLPPSKCALARGLRAARRQASGAPHLGTAELPNRNQKPKETKK